MQEREQSPQPRSKHESVPFGRDHLVHKHGRAPVHLHYISAIGHEAATFSKFGGPGDTREPVSCGELGNLNPARIERTIGEGDDSGTGDAWPTRTREKGAPFDEMAGSRLRRSDVACLGQLPPPVNQPPPSA
jgi:hypothetical protein